MKVKNIVMLMIFVLCISLLWGCAGKEGDAALIMSNEYGRILGQKTDSSKYWLSLFLTGEYYPVIKKEMKELVDLAELMNSNTTENIKLQREDFEQMFSRDYREEDYMENEISTTYFITYGGYCYELVSSQEEWEYGWRNKEIKVFVSKMEDNMFRLKQVLEVEELEGSHWMPDGMVLADANFDGIKDIIIDNGGFGNQMLTTYTCFLGDGEKYTLCEGYSEISNASIDADKQRITGFDRGSAVSHSFYVYVFQDGDFRLERRLTIETEYSTDREVYIGTVYETVNPVRRGEKISEEKLYWDEDQDLIREKFLSHDASFFGIQGLSAGIAEKEREAERDLSAYLVEGLTKEKLLACTREPDANAYFTDELVFLGEYPVPGTVEGVQYENLLLYGYRDQEGENVLVFLLGDKIYQAPWNWENIYRKPPEFSYINADEDEDIEILIETVSEGGIGWRERVLGLIDLKDVITTSNTVIDDFWVSSHVWGGLVSVEGNIAKITYDGEEYQIKLPTWANAKFYVRYNYYNRINKEDGTVDIRVPLEFKINMEYRHYEITLHCAIAVEGDDTVLKLISITQEE